jgi:hypothetical protein
VFNSTGGDNTWELSFPEALTKNRGSEETKSNITKAIPIAFLVLDFSSICMDNQSSKLLTPQFTLMLEQIVPKLEHQNQSLSTKPAIASFVRSLSNWR